MDYENMGVLEQISGLILGRPYGMTPEQKEAVWRVVRERTQRFGIPVVGNLDIGHTTPLLTLPLGGKTRIDSYSGRVSIMERAVHPT
jgi:muramoyltetrapeptide carboxypeptidase LdcA involved in peptidoglycan recycling